MKSVTQAIFLLSSAYGQSSPRYDGWDCNHFRHFALDVCYQQSSTSQYLYQCSGTNSVVSFHFTDGSCGENEAVPSDSTTYNNTYSSLFNCAASSACDYMILKYYYNDDCTGTYIDSSSITGECYNRTTSSTKYGCSGDNYMATEYPFDDCTGNPILSVNLTIDDDYNDNLNGCYDVCIFVWISVIFIV